MGIEVDASENIYITGQTASSDFPLINFYSDTLHGSSDAFVAKLNSIGDELLYSTLIGGSSYESAYDIS